MIGQPQQTYEFGPFRLIPAERQLLCDGQVVALTPKAFDLLLVLVEQSGHLVEKDELLKQVWPDSFVEEANLSVKMSALRRALGEGPNDHQYIETVPKRGYRFVARVNVVRDSPSPVFQQQSDSSVINGEEQHENQHEAKVQRYGNGTKRRTVRLKALVVSAIVVALTGLALFLWISSRRPALVDQPIRSVAVLPMENLSGDPNQEYFADGMTDALINEMGKISALRVISRQSVMQYKGTHKLLPEIARELGVDGAVEGSVTHSGERVGIRVQLIRAATDQQLWSENYDRDLRDVIALQSEVARVIASEINIKLTAQDQARLKSMRPVNSDAYEEFLWGLHFQAQFVNEQREEPDKEALKHFEQAIKIDPNFAPSYAHVTFSYGTLANIFGYSELFPKAREAAMKAVELDGLLPDAHGAMAYVLFNDWDWPGAEREFKRAQELNPSYSWGHWGYAIYLTTMGRYEEAISENRQAEKLEPVVNAPRANTGYIYYCMRDYDRGIEEYRKTLELSPTSRHLHNLIGFGYQLKGNYDNALAEYKEARDPSGDDLEYKEQLLSLYATAGRRHEAKNLLKELQESTQQKPVISPRYWAEIYALLDEKDESVSWLQKAFAKHDSDVLSIRCSPEFDKLRSDPRFIDLWHRTGLPQ